MDKKILGIFQTEQNAFQAIEELKRDGYADSEISVLTRQIEQSERIANATDISVEDTLSKGTGQGVIAGGVLGGLGALLVELGVLAIPGIGPVLAAGPIAVTLAGITAGGLVGGTVGLLAALGFNQKEAQEYQTYLNRGDILILVDDKGDQDSARKTFDKNGSVIRDKYYSP